MENKKTNYQTEQPEVYTVSEVAKMLNVSVQTARRVMQQPQIPSFKIGAKLLIRIKDFDEWFDSLIGKEIPLDPNVNKFKK